LYVEKACGLERRSAQTVCYYILDTLTKLMAPILSVTAELISDHYQHNKKASIHLQDFENLDWTQNRLFAEFGKTYSSIIDKRIVGVHETSMYACSDIEFDAMWQAMREVRGAVLKSLEELRAQGVIKHSLDAAVRLHISKEFKDYGLIEQLFALINQQKQDMQHFLKEYFIVSQIALVHETGDMLQVVPGIFVQASKAAGGKCVRCWQWEEFGKYDDVKQLCTRCVRVVS